MASGSPIPSIQRARSRPNPNAAENETSDYLMVDGAPALIWAANFAGIEIHPWTSTAANPEQPVTHRWTGGTRAVSWEWHKSKRGDPFLALVGVEQVLPTL